MNNDNANLAPATTHDNANVSKGNYDHANNRFMRRPNKEELMAAIRTVAERLGRAPMLTEFYRETSLNRTCILKHFASFSKALKACGLERASSIGHKITMEKLFEEWAGMARELGEAPTMAEYELRSRYSKHPLLSRFGSWPRVVAGMLQYAMEAGLEQECADVMEIARKACAMQRNGSSTGGANGNSNGGASATSTAVPSGSASGAPTGSSGGSASVSAWCNSRSGSSWVPRIRDDRPVYGPPLRSGCVGFAPNNEAAVMFLFATLAERLGFFMTYIGTKYPDAEAIREILPGRWQMVKIEFEYESRNFVEHAHDPGKCDLIVCWEHNWEECPLEVLELREVVERSGDRVSG